MFKRPHHQRVFKILEQINHKILDQAECYFGGGTAIALLFGEFRESVDIDFLCSKGGFNQMRSFVYGSGVKKMFDEEVSLVRDPYIDQYGIRFLIDLMMLAHCNHGVPDAVFNHVETHFGVFENEIFKAKKLLENEAYRSKSFERLALTASCIEVIESFLPLSDDAFLRSLKCGDPKTSKSAAL